MACTASYQEARASVTHLLIHRRYPSLEPGPVGWSDGGQTASLRYMVGGFVEFFAGEGVDEAGEEFFGVGAVLDDDVVGQGIGCWEAGEGFSVFVDQDSDFGAVGIVFNTHERAIRIFDGISGMGWMDRILVELVGVVPRSRNEAVLVLFFAEGEGFFLEVEALGDDVLVEGVHFEFVVEFAEVEIDSVGVHFGFALGFGLSTVGLRLGALFFGGTDFGARGEIGEALEGEELVRGVVVFGDELVRGVHDGVVDFFGGAVLAGVDFVVGGEG